VRGGGGGRSPKGWKEDGEKVANTFAAERGGPGPARKKRVAKSMGEWNLF